MTTGPKSIDPFDMILQSGKADLDEVLFRLGNEDWVTRQLADLYANGAIDFEARNAETLEPIAPDRQNLDPAGLGRFEEIFRKAGGRRSASVANEFLDHFLRSLSEQNEPPVSVSVTPSVFGRKKVIGF